MVDEPFFAIRVRGKVDDVAVLLAALDESAQRYDVFLQACDEGWVFDKSHAESAYVHARRAHERGEASSRTVGGEYLRYLTGKRQVGKAIEAGGVKKGQEAFVLVAAGAKAGAAVWRFLDATKRTRDPAGVGPNQEALDRLGVTAEERKAHPEGQWSDLALERVALVDLER